MPLKFEKDTKKLTKNSKLTFGKYRGKTIGSIMDHDIPYLVWCLDNVEWFYNRVETYLHDEIYDIYYSEHDNFDDMIDVYNLEDIW